MWGIDSVLFFGRFAKRPESCTSVPDNRRTGAMAKGAAGKRCRWEGCAQATGANAIRPFGEWPDACVAASLGDEASIQLSRPMA
ncbi:hypothetical protein VNPA131289_50110 [Pseudomonas aeruginosa]|nr:hypothetical protein VNPA131289_50110 [Pseudomonas aeruginosa]GLF29762.1 hypothetical protein VNPA141486_43680 [Pseudomonas aeruginosa]GLF50950.1 hypothetical protein VNPA141818_14520 [Pseudomonas aeruginosa]